MKVAEAMQPLGTPLTLPDGQPGTADGKSPGAGLASRAGDPAA